MCTQCTQGLPTPILPTEQPTRQGDIRPSIPTAANVSGSRDVDGQFDHSLSFHLILVGRSIHCNLIWHPNVSLADLNPNAMESSKY